MASDLHTSRFLLQRQPACLEAIRRHFCDFGCSPSYRELAHRIGVPTYQIKRILMRLAAAGEIGWTPGKARSITLPRRYADAANSELLFELRQRGVRVIVGDGSSAWPSADIIRTAPEVCRQAR